MSDKDIFPDGTLSECRFRIVSVFVLSVPFFADKAYDYRIQSDIPVGRGDFVAVPFGEGNRPETALVNAIRSPLPGEAEKLKPVGNLLDTAFSLSDEAMKIVAFLKERTFCSTGDAVRSITPSSAFSKLKVRLKTSGALPEHIPEFSPERMIYEFIKASPGCTKERVFSEFTRKKATPVLKTLTECGAVSSEITADALTNVKYTVCFRLAIPENELLELLSSGKLRSAAHTEILKYLAEHGKTEQSELQSSLSCSSAQLKALCEKGYILAEKEERYRIPYITEKNVKELKLSEEQRVASERIVALTKSGKPQAALLHGVTGSGKTSVMLSVMDEVIASGRQVILLVPEISLTPQTIGIFAARYGKRTAVLHSGLSAGERFDTWRRIKNGEIDICIGTRSAVFAPFERLGLIAIDEEQEHTYKSDQSPKYHARDVASLRCAYHDATMLLASATPSVESYHKAMSGIYTLCELHSRYGDAVLPETEIIDMRVETRNENFSLFSEKLVSEMRENLENGKQTILFLNRRGYHSFMCCPSCGNVVTCPHCSVSLTHHTSRFDRGGYLTCHYCGFKSAIPTECPSCKNGKMRFMGFGTQLAEEQLSKLFPDARILRMDADTTSGKYSYDEILGKFRNKEADILLGTQMVTKGHDFPGVTLVGMLSADQSLYLDDFRANERTFSLICQTVGRAGRGSEAGRAAVQCYDPDHKVIEMSRTQDYRSFYDSEIALRKSLTFPPFCDMAVITVTATGETEGFAAAKKLLEKIKSLVGSDFSDVGIQIFGPFEAPLYKLSERYRVRLVMKCKAGKRTRELFRQSLLYFGATMPQNITASIDINPTAL